ncbi:hypothetical protein FACS1894141_0930 [Spirochaetia bacterium]|nr:hypothetical protein FACS1894141_0930 [Spirochaetia bacterium]
MAVMTDPARDQLPFIIIVESSWKGTNSGSGSKKEHNHPHAYFYLKQDTTFITRFRIDSGEPPGIEQGQSFVPVNKTDPQIPQKYVKYLSDWTKAISPNSGLKNWDAMQEEWRKIQDFVNMGLKKPRYL